MKLKRKKLTSKKSKSKRVLSNTPFKLDSAALAEIIKYNNQGDVILYVDDLPQGKVTLYSRKKKKALHLRWYEQGMLDMTCYGSIGIAPAAPNRAEIHVKESLGFDWDTR